MTKIAEYDLLWSSSANERLHSDMNQRGRLFLEMWGVEIVEEFGGCMLDVHPDEIGADNGFGIRTSASQANFIAGELENVVGHPVAVVAR